MKLPARLVLFIGALLLVTFVLLKLRQDPASLSSPPVGTREVTPATPQTDTAAPERIADAPTPLPAIAPEFAGFDDWTQRYLAATPEQRPALIAEGAALAVRRRAALKELIAAEPREALARAVPPVVRQQLPPEIVALIEERVSERAFFGVLAVAPGADLPAIRREVRTAEKKYDAFVYGRRARQQTTEAAFIDGIALDKQLAVNERPLRVLDAGEIPVASEIVETCPISKKSTIVARGADGSLPPITAATPAVEVGGTVHYLCSGGHIVAFEDNLIAQEGGTGGPIKPGGAIPTAYTTGVKKHLYIRVTFPDQLVDPQSERDSYDMMRQVTDFMSENSFGQCYFITTVTPLLVLPHSEAWYIQESDDFRVLADSRLLAKAAGYDPAQFDFDTVRYNGGPGSFGGQAYVGGKGCWLKSSGVGVACHEYGHNLGLWHANYWNTSPPSIFGPGANQEYGNSFDTMGAANAGNNHYTAYHKNKLSWLPDNCRHAVITSGTYRIFQYDQPVLDPARRYSIRIAKDVDRDYWLEFRQKFTSNVWFMSGILFNWSSWGSGDTATGSNAGGQLLDLTPGSPDGKNDCALVIGRTFSDVNAGVHVTPIGKGGTTPESIDVVVNLGDFPGNQAPVLSINASAINVATNATVNFTATASDPDGDPLAHAWDFGDKTFGANAPAVSKSWGTAGRYFVRCTASDMKGKVTTRSVVIAVGSTTTFTISGQVTLAGAPIEGVLVQNGLTGTAFRGAYTDSDGNYTVTNLAAGNVTLSAAVEGYTFTPSFPNPIAVGPNATGKNFTAALTPTVTLTAPDNFATEAAGNGGVFRLTRTGSTAAALTVKLFAASGSATKGTDYTLTPDLVANTGVYDEIIPAGSATLDILLAPVQDATTEGVETATLQILPATGYIVAGSQQVTIDIADDESTLPVVNIVASDVAMNETGDTATVLITRTGSTAAALSVSFTFSSAAAGIATFNTDFTAPTSVVIPAGASSAPVTLTPVNDALAEGTETTTMTLSNLATYRRGVQQTQAFVLNDDDLNSVSVVASDSAAAEAGSDPGVFTITRTGDTTNALTVDYVLGGSAHHGTDYLPISGVASIPAGEAVTTLTITPIDDDIGEGTQTVILQLRSQPTYLVATPNSATINIADDDLPYVSVTPNDGTATENTDTAVFRFRRTGNSAAFTLHYTVGGTATPGTDYNALSGTVSFAAGDITKDVTVTTINDAVSEDAKTLVVTITPDPAYLISFEETATIMILDDDQPMVSVSNREPYSFAENGGTAQFWISRNGSTTAALDVNYTMSGTATAGADYAAPTGVITIPAAASGAYLTITGVDDAVQEGTETVTVNLAPGAYGMRLASATAYITDTETPPVSVRFSSASGSGAESVGTVNIPVTLSVSSGSEVTVEYAINAGSATGYGVDYDFTNDVLTFAPGETSKNLTLTINDDPFIEGSETVVITLSRPHGASLGTSTYTYTITDNDIAPVPTIRFATAASSGVESVASPLTMAVALSAAATGPVSVDYAVTGGTATSPDDYTLAAGTLNFAAGQLVKHVPLSIVNDPDIEPGETVVVTLSNAVGAMLIATAATHTFTITDDDAPPVTITASDASAGEPGNAGEFTVTRAGATTSELTVLLTRTGTATSGSDFSALPTSVVIPIGDASATVPLTVLNDPTYEGNETVTLTIAPDPAYSVGTPSSATITIADDEIGVTVAATDALAGEPANNGTFTVTRLGGTSGALVVNLTVSGTATSGTDYVAIPATATIADGQASASVPLTIMDDPTADPGETVTLTVAAGAGYAIATPASATITITDDDQNNAPTVTIVSPATSPARIPSGVGLVLEADADDDGRPAPPATLTTTWSKVSGPGTVTFGNATQQQTTATFSADGTYVLRITANDSQFSATRDLTVLVNVSGAALTGQDIGPVGLAGSHTIVSGTHTVRGAGANISGPSDAFYFLSQSLTGDGELRARLTSMSGGAASAKAGVMFRTAATVDSRAVFMSCYSPTSANGANSWRYRATDGASFTTTTTAGTTVLPFWLRAVRVGNVFSGYTSTNGTTWSQIGASQTVAMGQPAMVGLAVTSNNVSQLCTAVFDNVQFLNFVAANVGPLANAGPAPSAAYPAPLSLEGDATDDGLPTPPAALTFTWSQVSGPGTAGFADENAAQTTVTFTAAGSYVLRLTADDGEVKTFDNVVATSTAQSPYDQWRIAHFGADAGNPAIAGEMADPDLDGSVNVVEFTTGTAPLEFSPPVGVVDIEGANATFTYTRANAATDVTVTPQWNTDLATWQTTGLTDSLVKDNGTIQTRKATVPLGGTESIYFHLRITRP